ncbi:hypothetical protein [Escherichia phage PJNS034]
MIDKVLEQCASINQPRSLASVALKVSEETGELAQAVNKNIGNVVEEAADVIIAATDTAFLYIREKYGAEEATAAGALLEMAVADKLQKWKNLYSLEGKR